MALSDDLINFDLIEGHKENIQQLPGGRSAKQLASLLSPLPSTRTGLSPSLDETKTLNDAIRQEYENELLSIADSDDPLDIYDRYVKWTFNAYPSAQSTTQSQLLPLLERATKTFLTSAHYKNDPRYLKLWLHYIRFFDEAPKETFAFLARHRVGEGLGLFYEEFAAWLEGAGRWNQADEVYRMGVEKEARPAERLMRKYNQFQQRYEARPVTANEPSSPAIPTVRPALAAKIDPFSTTPRGDDSQRPGSGSSTAKPKSGKPKMAIFSDANDEAPPPSVAGTKGWDSIGSVKERKKENTIEPRPWAGETLKAGQRVGTTPKMEIFKDSKSQVTESKKSLSKPSDVVNPRTGRAERVFVNLEAVYSSNGEEFSFEELRAVSRGWTSKDWSSVPPYPMQPISGNAATSRQPTVPTTTVDVENLSQSFQSKIDIHDMSTQSLVGMPDPKSAKQKRLKTREVKQETQTVKTRLDSPTGRKIKRKGSAEPTMTFHSKAATNDIYDIFNHSNKRESREDTQSGNETDYEDDTYSIAGESVGTGKMSANNSEYEDDTTRSFGPENTSSQPDSVSPWSDFTASKHVPEHKKKSKTKHRHVDSDDLTDNLSSSQNQTMNTGVFDTQAIAAIADQDFGDMDTKMIARLAGEEDQGEDDEDLGKDKWQIIDVIDNHDCEAEQLETPVEMTPAGLCEFEIQQETRFVPIPPEGYEPTPVRPYRDPMATAQNKLPFMTPIVERTESSMAPSTIFQDTSYFNTKTPSRSVHNPSHDTESPSKFQIRSLLLSSPHEASPAKRTRLDGEDDDPVAVEASPKEKHIISLLDAEKNSSPFLEAESTDAPTFDTTNVSNDVPEIQPLPAKDLTKIKSIHKGPVILDLQCNPCDSAIQQQILDAVHQALSPPYGYVEASDQISNRHNQLKTFIRRERSTKSSPRKGATDRTLTKVVPPILKFAGAGRVYAVKRELGKGAYAPVYLVDSYDESHVEDINRDVDDPDKSQPDGSTRGTLEALKTESPPVSLTWEFYILRLLHARLGRSARSMMSIITAHECHLYRDECYLILDYHSQGTVLDLVNHARTEASRAGKAVEGLEETVVMWLSVELLRTMEAFHSVGILHGDLKADNCLVRFEPSELIEPYDRRGDNGWDSKGLMLIDFGRGIDVKAFKSEARFIADWAAEETDCPEIREARPWKWEIDLFGAAGVIHSLLFGKYIETIGVGGGGLGQKKEWKLKESFKRYWEKEIWSEVFHVLINGGGKKENEVREGVARVRELMEDWLEKEGERGGRDLRSGIRRCERLVGIVPGGRGKTKP